METTMELNFDGMTVDYKAVGFVGEFKIAELPESTIKAAVVYGLRRLIQDNCNSEANKLAKETGYEKGADLPESDRKPIYEARRDAMLEGTLNVKAAKGTSGLSPELARYLSSDRKGILKESGIDPKDYKAMDAAERTKALAEWMLEQSESVQDRWFAKGAKLLAIDEAHAKAIAELDLDE
jgi:hypothetical protein